MNTNPAADLAALVDPLFKAWPQCRPKDYQSEDGRCPACGYGALWSGWLPIGTKGEVADQFPEHVETAAALIRCQIEDAIRSVCPITIFSSGAVVLPAVLGDNEFPLQFNAGPTILHNLVAAAMKVRTSAPGRSA